jgi:hypothetical protein
MGAGTDNRPICFAGMKGVPGENAQVKAVMTRSRTPRELISTSSMTKAVQAAGRIEAGKRGDRKGSLE